MLSQLALMEEQAPFPAPERQAGAVRCLLVDDNRFDRYNVRYATERAGLNLEFFEAATAAEARQLLQDVAFGLIILDQNLPDGEGLELAVEASLSPHNAAAPKIMLTSMDDNRLAQGATEAGCVEFLTKGSLNGTTFSTALRGALDKSMATISADEFPEASDAFEMMLEGFGEVYLAQTIKPAISRILFLTERMRTLPTDSTEHATALAEIAKLCVRISGKLDTNDGPAHPDSFNFTPG
ncbi:MAG: response regulator [Pseudomonadota bacterium]